MLLMKKDYFPAIRAGRKTTTLRYWRSPRVRPRSVHTVPGLGKVRIDAVEAIDLRGLRDADARADGFGGVAALLRALGRLYPRRQRAGRRLYLVRFTFLVQRRPGEPSRHPKPQTPIHPAGHTNQPRIE